MVTLFVVSFLCPPFFIGFTYLVKIILHRNLYLKGGFVLFIQSMSILEPSNLSICSKNMFCIWLYILSTALTAFILLCKNWSASFKRSTGGFFISSDIFL